MMTPTNVRRNNMPRNANNNSSKRSGNVHRLFNPEPYRPMPTPIGEENLIYSYFYRDWIPNSLVVPSASLPTNYVANGGSRTTNTRQHENQAAGADGFNNRHYNGSTYLPHQNREQMTTFLPKTLSTEDLRTVQNSPRFMDHYQRTRRHRETIDDPMTNAADYYRSSRPRRPDFSVGADFDENEDDGGRHQPQTSAAGPSNNYAVRRQQADETDVEEWDASRITDHIMRENYGAIDALARAKASSCTDIFHDRYSNLVPLNFDADQLVAQKEEEARNRRKSLKQRIQRGQQQQDGSSSSHQLPLKKPRWRY